ncbi:hypothetical protein JR316_0001496 [Psilocybe cubensis]|uniref:Uncharacterized protein n=2 Tax=Psilocybe cubensis TaxID=181762 RepID=A0ACB8HIB3_PSICU|nr:hypothetical protein JR316_0001496 [Psilocybe cubensis]KAH9487421.1 hypothetical protein JR316_0001496 [Psilocybe cubensis]
MSAFTTPFTEYLHTNYVPTSIDRAQIRQLLVEPEAALAKIDDDIRRLQALVDEIRQQKASLDETIHEHYLLLTPFRRLPDDILTEIFCWTLPDMHNALMSSSEPPLLLGRVCSRWRSLAYHTPRLWSTLHVPLPVPPSHNGLTYWMPSEAFQQLSVDFEGKFRRHCQAVVDWLNRSGSRPLSLSINPRDSVSHTHQQYFRPYLEILLAFSDRWHKLEISIPSTECSSLIASIPASSVPKLRYLHLKFSRRSAHENVWARSGILKTPTLRVLYLSGFPFRLSGLEMNWSQVTHLILSDNSNAIARQKRVSLEEAYRIFSLCKNLQHVTLDIIDTPDAVSPTDPLDLPYLESLAIIDGAHCIATLIECFNVPSLRIISYHTNFWPSTARRSPLILLLLRTNNRVEVLTTDLQFFMVSDIIECMELVPSLRCLVNVRSKLGVSREQARSRSYLPFIVKLMKGILDILLPNSYRECLCPRLEIIRLKDSLILSDQDAANFIQTRLEASKELGIARLTEVSITFTREPLIDIEAHLQPYIQEGLKLHVAFPAARKVTVSNFNPLNGLVKRDSTSEPLLPWL